MPEACVHRCTDTCKAMAIDTLCILPHHAHRGDAGAESSQSSNQLIVTSLNRNFRGHHHQCHVSPTMMMRQAVTAVQLPEEQLEVYGKGQHLRGADAAFADQVLDELVRHLQPVPSSRSNRAVQHAACNTMQVYCAATPAHARPSMCMTSHSSHATCAVTPESDLDACKGAELCKAGLCLSTDMVPLPENPRLDG